MSGRALVFNEPNACRLIREKCVPLAWNHMLSTGYAADDEFLSRLGAGFVLCTAQGKVLDRDRGVLGGLAAFAKLPVAEREPGEAGIGPHGSFDPKRQPLTPPVDGLILKVYQRTLDRDGMGKLSAPSKMDVGGGYWRPAEPQRDFLWLTEAEWKSLVPVKPRVGDSMPVPRTIQRRIFRFHLTQGPVGLLGAWAPDHVRNGSLVLTVLSVSADTVELRLEGNALLADHTDLAKAKKSFDARLLGVLSYDLNRRCFTRVDFVAVGDASNPDSKGSESRAPLGIAFELTQGNLPGDRRPPRGTWIERDRQQGLHTYMRAE
jgi:hypothetical protein